MKRQTNKLVLLIVEGQSEMNALYPLMKRYFSPDNVLFHVYKGDLTVRNYGSSSPVKEIEKILTEEMRKYGLARSDIREVVEITDTDGIFAPDQAILMDESAQHIIYTEDAVFTAFPESIAERNGKRRHNIGILLETEELKKGIPFRLFYLSRNIEHALYGIDRTVSDNKKTDLAYDFSDEFGSDIDAFREYLYDEDIALGDDYRSSWLAIMDGYESLRRHTNLHILLR